MFQDDFLIPYLTIKENILITNKSIDEEDLTNIAKKLEIDNFLDKYPNELSGGERQRVSLSRALLNYPKIILCDEPTSSLDEVNAIKVMDLLKENSDGKLVIITTHDINLAYKYGTKIIQIHDGKLIEKSLTDRKFNVCKASNNVPYKSKNIIDETKRNISFFKRYKKFPLLTILLFSLCLTLLMGLIGGYSGIKNYQDNEVKGRIDSQYYEFSSFRNGEIYDDLDILYPLDKNKVNYKEYNNLNYLFNNFLKNEFNRQNNILFTYDFSIIDFQTINYSRVNASSNPKVLVNSLFEKEISKKNFVLDYKFNFLNTYDELDFEIGVCGIVNESKLYNTPKIYIDYEYATSLFTDSFINYIYNEQEDLIIPTYICIYNDVSSFNKFLEKERKYQSYLSLDDLSNTTTYYSSNIILTTTFKDLLESLLYIFITLIVIIMLCVLVLFTHVLAYLLSKRKIEYAIKKAYGIKQNDINLELLLQSLLICLTSLIVSILLYYLIHYIGYRESNRLFEINYCFDLIEFESIGLMSGCYVSLLCALISAFDISKKLNKQNIMEVLKNE